MDQFYPFQVVECGILSETLGVLHLRHDAYQGVWLRERDQSCILTRYWACIEIGWAMQLETSRFGTLDIDDASVITFTQPIIGFAEYRRFVMCPGPEGSAVVWLQSIDDGDLAFILMNPRSVVPDYAVRLSAHELAELAVSDVEQLDVYTLVVVPQDATKVRTNLKAPVLINPEQRLGKQTILEKSSYPVQFLVAQSKSGAEAS